MTDLDVPRQWKAKRNADGSLIADTWLTPGGYTVAICRLKIMPVAVIRAREPIPFAYVQTLQEVPVLIAADLQASMTPAFRAAFAAIEVAKC